jgi:hypothetical protein
MVRPPDDKKIFESPNSDFFKTFIPQNKVEFYFLVKIVIGDMSPYKI